MARSIRIQSAGAYYHVMARGNRTAATQGATPGPVRTTGYPATNALNQYEAINNPRVLEVGGTIAEGFTPGVKVYGVPWLLSTCCTLTPFPRFPVMDNAGVTPAEDGKVGSSILSAFGASTNHPLKRAKWALNGHVVCGP